METETPTTLPASSRSSPLKRLLIIALLFFVIGIAAMGWALTQWAPVRNLLIDAPPPAATPAPTITYMPRPSAPGEPDAQLPHNRVAALEQRLEATDEQADAASSDAGRAEGLLIAFAARRAIDRGLPLGYLEGALRQHFGRTQPQSVAAIAAAARQPVTLEGLAESLKTAAPALMGGGPDEGWFDSLSRSLSNLFVIRDAGTTSAAPAERLARAERYIQSGRVDAALAEVTRMPGAGQANGWTDAARRYVSAHQALDRIEEMAIRSTGAPAAEPAALPTAPALTPAPATESTGADASF